MTISIGRRLVHLLLPFKVLTVRTEQLESTREIIISLLCTWNINIPLSPVPYDNAFHKLCIEDATRRGFPLESRHSLPSFIRGGVILTTTAYAHIPDENMKVLIALWLACFIYVDDKFLQDSGPIYEFQDHFVRGISQEDPVLEMFAGLIREMTLHLHRIAANLFVTSTLNGVTGVLLEKETQGMQVSSYCSPYFYIFLLSPREVSSAAAKYPTYSRIMSIAAEAFAILAFPQSLPLNSYIHALPEAMTYFMNIK